MKPILYLLSWVCVLSTCSNMENPTALANHLVGSWYLEDNYITYELTFNEDLSFLLQREYPSSGIETEKGIYEWDTKYVALTSLEIAAFGEIYSCEDQSMKKEKVSYFVDENRLFGISDTSPVVFFRSKGESKHLVGEWVAEYAIQKYSNENDCSSHQEGFSSHYSIVFNEDLTCSYQIQSDILNSHKEYSTSEEKGTYTFENSILHTDMFESEDDYAVQFLYNGNVLIFYEFSTAEPKHLHKVN